MKISGFIFLAIIIFYNASAQYTLFKIHYESKSIKDTFHLSVYSPVNFPILQLPPKSFKVEKVHISRRGNNNTMTATCFTGHLRNIIVGNGFGGCEVLLTSNDTLEIDVKKFVPERKFLVDSFYNYMFLDFKYLNKNNKIHQFFDSLAYIAGQINIDNISFSNSHYNLKTFFKKATFQYEKRMHYLNTYSSKYLTDSCYHLAKTEIKSVYAFNLLSVFLQQSKTITKQMLSQQYIDSLHTLNLDDQFAFFNCVWYKPAVFTYVSTMLNDMDYENYFSELQFNNRYKSILANFKGKMKDNLLTSLLSEFYKKDIINSAILADFRTTCKSKEYIHSIDSLNSIVITHKAKSQTEALISAIKSSTGVKSTLKDIIFKKPIIIDCWASWCNPCIIQIPENKNFEKIYGSQIDFVYLSFDTDSIKWKKKIGELGLDKSKCYQLINNFKSDFAVHFDITTIPRYIVINKDGKVINSNAARPSRQKEYNEMLKHLVE